MDRVTRMVTTATSSRWVSWVLLAASCAGRPVPTELAQTPEAAVEPRDDDAAAQELIARVEQAIEAWNDSCPQPNEWGLCIEFSPIVAESSRCHPPVLGAVVVHPRDTARAAAAQAELVEIMDVAGCDEGGCGREVLDVLPAAPDVLRAYERALAGARLARTDAALEAYFGRTLPEDARLLVSERQPEPLVLRESESFREFVRIKMDQSGPLMLELARVKGYDDVESLLGAALRTSWTSLHLSDELGRVEIPAVLRDDARDDFCKALDDKAALARSTAREAVKYCTVHADQSGSRSHTARTCRALLERLEQ